MRNILAVILFWFHSFAIAQSLHTQKSIIEFLGVSQTHVAVREFYNFDDEKVSGDIHSSAIDCKYYGLDKATEKYTTFLSGVKVNFLAISSNKDPIYINEFEKSFVIYESVSEKNRCTSFKKSKHSLKQAKTYAKSIGIDLEKKSEQIKVKMAPLNDLSCLPFESKNSSCKITNNKLVGFTALVYSYILPDELGGLGDLPFPTGIEIMFAFHDVISDFNQLPWKERSDWTKAVKFIRFFKEHPANPSLILEPIVVAKTKKKDVALINISLAMTGKRWTYIILN